MMEKVTCKGIPAWWVNGWLAAVGATFLDARIRLSWTESSNLAVLSAVDCDPVDALVESWPTKARLSDMPIAKDWKDEEELERKITVDSFRKRVRAARRHPLSWTLSSTITDLSVDKNGEVAHAPFDPPGPGTVKWLHYRLSKIHRHVGDHPSTEQIRDSLMGEAPRVKDNGLGFDLARIGSLADKSGCRTDPVVEVMSFFGLALLPMRGFGFDDRLRRAASANGRQRGWRRPKDGSGKTRCFHWPAWSQPLNADGIDALLDVWKPDKKSFWPLLGVHDGWRSIAFETDNKNNPTRAYGSEWL